MKELVLLIFTVYFCNCQINYDSLSLDFARLRTEEKLSSNIFLGNIILDQEKDPESCSADQGPQCKFVNSRSLNHEERTTEDQQYSEVKKIILPQFKPIMKEVRSNLLISGGFPKLIGGGETIYYPNGRMRLDQSLYPSHFPKLHTFTFSFFSFTPEPKVLKPFLEDVKFKLQPDLFTNPALQKLKHLDVKVNFEKIFLQKKEATLKAKTKRPKSGDFQFLETDTEREKVMFGDLAPEENYALTLRNSPGLVKFSIPMTFRFVFLRPGFMQEPEEVKGYKADQNLTKDPDQRAISYEPNYIIGRIKGKQVFHHKFALSSPEWKRVYLPRSYTVDELEISPNTQIDNLEIQLDYNSYELSMSSEEIKNLVKLNQPKGKEKLNIDSSALEEVVKQLNLGQDLKVLSIASLEKDGKIKILKGDLAKKKLESLVGKVDKALEQADEAVKKSAKSKARVGSEKSKQDNPNKMMSSIKEMTMQFSEDIFAEVQAKFQEKMKGMDLSQQQKSLEKMAAGMELFSDLSLGKISVEELQKKSDQATAIMSEILGKEAFDQITKKFEKRLVDFEKKISVKSGGGSQKNAKSRPTDSKKNSQPKKKQPNHEYTNLDLEFTPEEEDALSEIDSDFIKDTKLNNIRPKEKKGIDELMAELNSQDDFDGDTVDELEKLMEQEDLMNKELLKELGIKQKKTGKKTQESVQHEKNQPHAEKNLQQTVEPILEYSQPITRQPKIEQGSIKSTESLPEHLSLSEIPATEEELEEHSFKSRKIALEQNEDGEDSADDELS